MRYQYVAIPDAEVPPAADPAYRHLLDTYVSETNKTASMWRAVPDDRLEFKPHEKVITIRAILAHQLLSERRFFERFIGLAEPPAEAVLPSGDRPAVAAYIDRYVELCRRRLPAIAAGTAPWWHEPRTFFGHLTRERIWIFWRRVLHTCHHRTQVQTWLRLAGCHVPAIYGPSGDETWADADPTNTVTAAGR